MRLRTLGVITAFTYAAAVSPALAQGPRDESQNAALRYWMAFAQMQETPASGKAKPDILSANAAALATLARASQLPFCEWGIEYALGPDAPIAHLPKARALASLNTSAALRAVSNGKGDQAVDGWLVGMRFARHIESGGTLIATLSAWTALRQTWDAIDQSRGRLTSAQRVRLADAIRALPETVFAWDSAVLNEARVLERAAAMARNAGAPAAPTEMETKRFLREIERVGDALSRGPNEAAPTIAAYEKETEVHRFYRASMPSLTKINETRREVKAAREKLLAALT